MNLDRFEQLPRTPDGRTVVVLMHDPAMTDADGNEVGFLSVVNRGANGRNFLVAKADLLEENGGGPAFLAREGAVPGGPWEFLRRTFGALFGLGAAATAKSDDPVTFDAALSAPRVSDALWQAGDALRQVVRNILADESITDKAAMIAAALDSHKAYILTEVKAALALVTKADQRRELADAVRGMERDGRWLATKAGRMISAPNMATLTAALASLQEAVSAVQGLIKAATPATTDKSEDPMKLDAAQLATIGEAAGTVAISLARKQGTTDPATLQAIGERASATAIKEYVTAGAQPSLTPGLLTEQLGQAAANGKVPDVLARLETALGGVTGMAMKLDALGERLGKLEGAINGSPSGDGKTAEPGLLAVVAKHGELAVATAQKVAMLANTPARPRGSSEPPQREVTAKADDKTFEGTALSGFGR